MTKEELLKYRKISHEIDLLKRQLEKVEPEYTTDSVTGSYVDFPFVQHNIKISGYDTDTYKKRIANIKRRLSKNLNELMEEKDKLTEYIYSLDDSSLRQILIYKYIDGLSWMEIGNKMNYATSTVRLKHDTFMKRLAPISTSNVL